jgi:hypothetical protein
MSNSSSNLSDEDDYYQTNDQNNEADVIKEELEEMELGKIIQARTKLQLENERNIKRYKKKDKKLIENKILEINKNKSKGEPKEFSALVKPKNNLIHTQNDSKVRRDPRFEDTSGTLNDEMYTKNYDFVYEKSKNYLNKINEIKTKSKKKHLKIEDNSYELIQKQINYVKGWIKSKDFKKTKGNIEKGFKSENRIRIKKGLNPIHIKKTVFKNLVKNEQSEKRTEKEQKEYLKKKKQRDIVKNKKAEKSVIV